MPDLQLTAAFGDYDRITPLRTGQVRAQGIDLRVLALPAGEIFSRMCQHLEFDASEMSMGAHLNLIGAGESPFIGLPAFPSRAFRHAMLYANVDAGIERPEDLNGKRIAIREWGMTAVLCIVGILTDEHGLDIASVDWVAAVAPRVSIAPPAGVRIRLMAPGEDLSGLLEAGAVDAALTHTAPRCFTQGSPRVRRVFADHAQAERDYFARTRVHPIMHCAVLRRDVYERNPWVMRNLYEALCEAKAHAARELLETGTLAAMVPFLAHAMDDTRALFGEDWWPYGVEANRVCLQRMTRHAFEQGLTPRVLDVEELFGETVRT